ncbi:EAL domain-containing protein [Vibrio sp. V31_P5A7T61]|nr:EAL domain-containing protein [Vibrio sp. V31_P5A7T61]NAX02488.1 EAL domain-containing protein [Vibrio sp. V34_P3A8T189]NAX09429.1 EAL domain-containing protein [Vibrio sp. V40_P2S30T141]NAX65351.1 EAL domain-containing protein [Vibrio sp. V32_P6A28T40]
MVMEMDSRERAQKQRLSEAGYRSINWSLDLKTHQFSCDQRVINDLLDTQHSFTHIKDFLRHMTPNKAAEMKRCFKFVIETGAIHYFSCSLVIPNQALTYVEFCIERASADSLKGSITPLIQLDSLKELAHLFEGVFDNPHHGLILTDEQTQVLACNRYFEQHSGFKQHELLGKKASVFNANKHSNEFFQSMWQHIHHHGYWSGAILNRRASGKVAPQELTIQKIKLQDGRVFFLGMTLNLENQLESVAEKSLGHIDLLTQLPIEEKFKELLELYYQDHQDDTTLIVLAFQPSFSIEQHHAEMLILSSFLTQCEEVKVVGYLGKGIYTVCLSCSSCIKSSDFRHIQDAIRRFMYELKREPSIHNAVIRGRIGVSIMGLDAKTSSRMVTHAMQAMLEQHAGESKTISFYHSEIHQQVKRRKSLEDLVSKAISERDLEVHYQPIVDTKTWEIVKFEALCRFKPTKDNAFTTQEMISIAEDLNLISELDRTVGILSLQALPKIKMLFGQHIGLTINRSFNSKMDAVQILTNTLEMIENHTDSPQSITIELTESAYFDSQSKQANALKSLREQGVTVAIDDFGTGYSSFTYLSDCHFDYLKIDREFVTDIQLGSNKCKIVNMIIGLCHSLGIKVVAEGVETEQEVMVLKSLGVDYMQGYFFSKPLPFTLLHQAKNYRRNLVTIDTEPDQQQKKTSLIHLFKGKPHLDPSEPLSLVDKYFKVTQTDALPVINKGVCVGIVLRETLNLHLTPTMGTELETMREAAIWRRPVNQLMQIHFTQLNADTKQDKISELISNETPFPWVLVDGEKYKGLLTQADVLLHLAERQPCL